MKVCIVIDDYLPYSIRVGAKMMHELAIELKSRGHEITVITPRPEQSERVTFLNLDGVNVIGFKSGKIKDVSKTIRALNESLLSFRAWYSLKPFLIKNKHDIIIYYSPTIFWGYLVKQLKKIWGVKSYLILRDIFPQWIIDNGIIKKDSLVSKFFHFFEKLNYSQANRIGVMSQSNLEWFKKNSDNNEKVEILSNWATENPISIGEMVYRKKLKIEKKTVYFYGGNIGHAQDMSQILRLAKRLQDTPEAYFVLLGSGDEVSKVKEFIQSEKLTNLIILDPVSQDEFKLIMAEFDIGLFSLHRNHTTHNIPGKILGYMVQGMPILGCVNHGNDLMQMIKEANAGYISLSGDDESFEKNARKLLDSKVRRQLGENSKLLLRKHFSVNSAATKVLGIYS